MTSCSSKISRHEGQTADMCVAWESLSISLDGMQSQDPIWSNQTGLLGNSLLHTNFPPRRGHEEGTRELVDIGVGSHWVHIDMVRWAQCLEGLGCDVCSVSSH